MKLILIRHGESTGNKNKVIYGWTDYPLTDKGLEQAEKITRHLHNTKIIQIYTSPLVRAKAIAKKIANTYSITYIEDSRLKELNYGIFEGLTEKEILFKYNEEYQLFLNKFDSYTIKNGECYSDFKDRIIKFLEDNLYKKELLVNKNDDAIILTTHGGVIREILVYLLGLNPNEMWDYPINPGSIVEMNYNQNSWEIINIFQT